MVIVIAICLRTLTFKEELQFHFNESYFLVQKLLVDKSERIFRYIKLRMQENFLRTWYTVFQQCSNLAIPMLIVLAFVDKHISFLYVMDDKSLEFDFTFIQERMQNQTSEAKALGDMSYAYNIAADKDGLNYLAQ
jgi:hypothetical protein